MIGTILSINMLHYSLMSKALRRITPERLFIVIVLLLHVFAYRSWVFNTKLISDGDWMISYASHSKELFQVPTAWKSDFLGGVHVTPTFYPFQLIEGILASIGFDYALIERILFIWPIVFLSPIWIFLLLRHYSKHTLSAIIGSSVYLYNTYFIILQTGHLTLMMSFSLAPLSLLLLEKTIQSTKISTRVIFALLNSFVLFAISFYEFRAFYLVGILFIIRLIYELIRDYKFSNLPKSLRLCTVGIILPLTLALTYNAFWIETMPLIGGGLTSTIQSQQLFGDSFFSMLNSMSLYHPFWTGGEYFPFIVQNVDPLFLSLLAVSILGLVINRTKTSLFYSSILLVGIFLSKQTAEPFGSIYLFLFKYVPGFSFFREASKFYFFVAIAYSVLTTIGLEAIWRQKKLSKLVKVVPFMLLSALSLFNIKPLLTNEIGMLFVPKSIPVEYQILNEQYYNNSEYFRTLWIPNDSRWSYADATHPKLSIISLLNSSWMNLEDAGVATQSAAMRISSILSEDFAPDLLAESSIRYLAIPSENESSSYEVFKNYGERMGFVSVLDNKDYLSKIPVSDNRILLYEVDNYRPHIFIDETDEHTQTELKYSRTTDSEYSITLSHVVESLNIDFSESYNSQWRLRIGEFSWHDALLKKNYFIDPQYHEQTEYGLNSYRIDPKVVCTVYNCKENTDGSYDIEVTLYFYPQAYMNLGSVFSVAVLGLSTVCLLTLLADLLVKKNKSKNLHMHPAH